MREVRVVVAALRSALGHVLEVSAEPHVLDIAARRVVATVENVHPVWDRPSHEHPHESMGAPLHTPIAHHSVVPWWFEAEAFIFQAAVFGAATGRQQLREIISIRQIRTPALIAAFDYGHFDSQNTVYGDQPDTLSRTSIIR